MNEFKPKYLPAVPVHPGLSLREELEARELSPAELANSAGLSLEVIHEIISERELIGEPIAHKLEQALDISAQFWLNATTLYNLTVERDAARATLDARA